MAGWWDAISTGVGDYFSDGSGWSDLLGGVMSGLGGMAAANSAEDAAEQGHEWALAIEALRGNENRRTSLFEAQLADYVKQKDNFNKRVALDTYGQFSVLNRRSPGYVPPAAPVAPTAPSLENFNGG